MSASNPSHGAVGASAPSSSSSSSPARPPLDSGSLPPDSRPISSRPSSRPSSALLFPPPPPPPPLHVTIRFSASLPDLHLDVPSPQQTTVVALKHLIRGRLAADAEAGASSKEEDAGDQKHQPAPAAQAALARLRFIHNGRILPDTAVLSAVLRAPPPPPLAQPDPKGKSPHHRLPQQRVFINCSIGDALSPSELQDEAALAAVPAPAPAASPSSRSSLTPSPQPPSSAASSKPPTPHPLNTATAGAAGTHAPNESQSVPPPPRSAAAAAAPRGFDRLVQAGLTPSEISTLRSHFRAIHTARFTPDSMPSPDTLRSMEDAWLDSQGQGQGQGSIPSSTAAYTSTTATYGGSGGLSGGGEVVLDGGGDVDVGSVEEDAFGLSAVAGPLVKGMLIGFVWPLGVLGWVGKEDGVWSRRMHVFVVFGVLLSLSVGLVRELTGDG